MKKGCSRLRAKAERFRKCEVVDLIEVFGGRVKMSEGFGQKTRKRLFFSLYNLLAVPLSSDE
jgi:hypothetical protein